MSYRIITISREFESGGSEIAQAVAAKLDLPYYDRFLITVPSQETGISEERLALKDERMESRFEYSRAQAAYTYTSEDTPLPTGAQLAQVQFQLIRDLADQGPCLIVGRCANFVLRERDDVLDIFIHAGVEYRTKRTMTQLGLNEKQAKKVLRQTDRARKAYFKNYTGRNWDDPDLYHARLNPARLGNDACIDMICDLYRR